VTGPNRRNVILVDDAVLKMATLNPTEQSLVQAEVARMSNPEFRPESDRRGHRRGGGGRAYFVHEVTGSPDIRLWYRRLENSRPTDPETLAVMVVDRKGEPA
jgi:hypothetical protein